MKRGWQSPLWRAALISIGGGIGIVCLAIACFWVELNLATTAFALLILIAFLSLLGSFVASVVLSVVALGCLNYLFAPPLYSLRVEKTEDVIVGLAFLTTSIIITGLAARMRRIAEEELRETRAELARFARVATLGELTASIAHEVNQPLAGVVSSGNACQRWLASDPPNIERARQSLDRIIRDANRASEVVERVRSLTKKTPPQMGALNLNEAIQEIIVLTRSEVEQNRVSLRTQLADDPPFVWADRIQLQQVFLNLIVNAIEAIGARGDGPRDLLITTAADGPDGVLSTVRDTGDGLDPEQLQHIFDAFYTTKRDGMGIGLAVSRSIIEAHGGRLWATPNEPCGAVLQIRLPASREPNG